MSAPDSALWHEALAQVPGIRPGAGVEARRLAGGTTNATYRVDTAAGSFVVRLHDPYTRDLGVDRRREAVLHAAAAQAGFASRVLAADTQGRYLVTEFLTGTPWRAVYLEDEDRLQDLARTLAGLHALPAPEVPDRDLAGLLEQHAAQILLGDPGAGGKLMHSVARARQILARQRGDRAACIVHGDLTHSNLIGSDPLRLVDWEYAVVGDPLADIACLLAYYPHLQPRAAMLLRGCGLAADGALAALEDLTWVYRLASDLWYRRLALARQHQPPAH